MDINLEEYFSVKQFLIDKIDNSKLNLRRAIHKMKVIKKVEELIYSTKLENIIDEYYNLNTSTDILEEIDNQISAVLDAARRYVEESK